jgi:hypothetical protein
VLMNDTTSSPPGPEVNFLGIFAILGIVAGIFLAFFRAWAWSSGEFGGEAFGYALSGVLIPGLISYAIAGRKKARNLNRFGLVFFVVSVFAFALEVSQRQPKQRESPADLVKEATGKKAVDPANSSETDRLGRTVLGDMLAIRKSHDAQVAKFSSDLSRIYSAESFSNRVSMQRCIDAVQGTLQADEDFSHQFQGWRDHIKEKVDHSSLSGADKEGFIQGVERTIGGSDILKVRDQIVEAEEKWAAATKDLYTFAMANDQKIKVKDSDLLIDDEKVRSDFNRQLKDCRDLRSKMRSLNSQLRQLQDAAMKQIGITRDDLGLGQSQSTPQ